MRKLRIVTNRKIRNLSWKIRPTLVELANPQLVMYFVFMCCITGLTLTVVSNV